MRETEIEWSDLVRQRSKVHLLDKGYAWVSKTRDFAKDSRKEFGNQRFRVKGVSTGLPRIFFIRFKR